MRSGVGIFPRGHGAEGGHRGHRGGKIVEGSHMARCFVAMYQRAEGEAEGVGSSVHG